MKLIIGIGNPGEKYRNNRHSLGHLVVDELKNRITRSETVKTEKLKDFLLKKTDVYMNESGGFVKKLVEQYKVNTSDLWIIHDDLDIKLGDYKIQLGKGPKDHHGLASIDEALSTSDYWHVRIGIENRNNESGITNYGGDKVSGKEYVLQNFTKEENDILKDVISKVTDDLYERFKG